VSKPILELGNSNNWSPVWAFSTTSQPVPDRPGYTFPIEDIEVPFVLDAHIIAVAMRSPSASAGRRYAGKATRKVPTGITIGGNFDVTVGERRDLYLNRINLCRFTRLSQYYGLVIEPYWKIKDIEIAIFKYVGVDSDTTSESLNRIEQAIDNINGY
jgi:hypothetical protein